MRTVSVSALSFGATLAGLALAPGFGVALVTAILLGFCSVTFLTASTAIVQLRSAPEMRGRVLALQAMLFLGSTPIGGPIVGWVAEEFGARWSVALGAVACAAAGTWGLSVARGRAGRRGIGRPVGGTPPSSVTHRLDLGGQQRTTAA